MRVFLHIGTDKTGSTSIESALFRNRGWLRERSVYVPETGLGRDNGHALLLEKLRDGELASLERELTAAQAEGFTSAVISWEGMVRFRRERIRKLYGALGTFDICILVYLREQAQIIQSAHLQWIKMSKRALPIRALAAPVGLRQRLVAATFIRDPHRNYYRTLCRWRSCMPGADFRVRVFDHSRLVGGDVVNDFLQQLGVERDDAFAPPRGPTNPSLDIEGALLVEGWRANPDYRDRLDRLIDVTQSVINHEGSQTRYFLDETAVRTLRKHYARSNRRLATQFGHGGNIFSTDRACWRADTLVDIEARSRQMAQRVWEVNCIPTLWGNAHGSAVAGQVLFYEGWSNPEPWGVWSVGRCSRLRFRVPARLLPAYASSLRLSLHGRYHGAIKRSRVTINGLDFGEHDLSASGETVHLPVDALQPYEVVDISLEHASSKEPAPDGDQRDLAFALSAIGATPQYDP